MSAHSTAFSPSLAALSGQNTTSDTVTPRRTIKIEAETLQEARQQLTCQIPEGFRLLRESVISDGKPKTLRALEDTTQAALAKVQSQTPSNAVLMETRVIAAPAHQVITLLAMSEHGARMQLQSQISNTATIRALRLVTTGSKGLFGIGAKPNEYCGEVFQQAVVEVTYKMKATIMATIAEREVCSKLLLPTYLAVRAYERQAGSLAFVADDTCGHSYDLGRVNDPAWLYVPREVLPHLKKNENLWRRVRDVDGISEEDGTWIRLDSRELLLGQFRVLTTGTYLDALARVSAWYRGV